MTPTTRNVLVASINRFAAVKGVIRLSAAPPFPRLASVAVYVAEDWSGRCLYVGSTQRPPAGAEARLTEHLRERPKSATWRTLYVIELSGDTPPLVVRSLEGLVGLHLRPTQSARLPLVRLGAQQSLSA